jgi:hypothetical protein
MKWKLRANRIGQIPELILNRDIPNIIIRLLINRGIMADKIINYIYPDLRIIENKFLKPDANKEIEKLISIIRNGGKVILIYDDELFEIRLAIHTITRYFKQIGFTNFELQSMEHKKGDRRDAGAGENFLIKIGVVKSDEQCVEFKTTPSPPIRDFVSNGASPLLRGSKTTPPMPFGIRSQKTSPPIRDSCPTCPVRYKNLSNGVKCLLSNGIVSNGASHLLRGNLRRLTPIISLSILF